MNEGEPFTATMTTRRFMLTPRLMLLYAYMDNIQVDDSGGNVDLFARANPTFSFKLTAKEGAIPLSDTFDRQSPHYMTFYAPQLVGAPYVPFSPWIFPIPLPTRLELHFAPAMRFEGTGNEDDATIEEKVDQVKQRIADMIEEGRRSLAG